MFFDPDFMATLPVFLEPLDPLVEASKVNDIWVWFSKINYRILLCLCMISQDYLGIFYKVIF